jgi:hypothetical protein
MSLLIVNFVVILVGHILHQYYHHQLLLFKYQMVPLVDYFKYTLLILIRLALII